MKNSSKLIPFIERNPTEIETLQFKLAMSTFCDGSGQEKDNNRKTRPGWRDLERVVEELLDGFAPENKDIFDVFVESKVTPSRYFGISLKSKQISRKTAINDLMADGRVHMEIANSPAKFWAALRKENISESDFRKQQKAGKIGEIITNLVAQWHIDAAKRFSKLRHESEIDLGKSIYMTISYSKLRPNRPRLYQIHAFDLKFPRKIIWEYISQRCLRGYDPDNPKEALIDWYGLSGGQLKYYPRASTARFSSKQFGLLIPQKISIRDKAKSYWKNLWKS